MHPAAAVDVDPMRLRPRTRNTATTRTGLGWCVWLALVAVGLQAPSISVRHCHAGGSDPHHHGLAENFASGLIDEGDDLALPHGHRVVWGFDLHEPTGSPADCPADEPSTPAGVISANLALAAEGPEGPVLAGPTPQARAATPHPVSPARGTPKMPPSFRDFSSLRTPVLRV